MVNKVLRAEKMYKCIGCSSCMLACASRVQNNYSIITSSIRIKSLGGMQGRFIADYCRGCNHPDCSESCSEGALSEREGGGVVFNSKKCNSCGRCISACSAGAIRFDHENKKPIVCIQCGTCAKFCPHRVLTMEVNDNVY